MFKVNREVALNLKIDQRERERVRERRKLNSKAGIVDDSST